MAKVRGDDLTDDLFDWTPPDPVERYADDEIRAASLKAQISRAVATTLKDSDKTRDQIAEEMGAYLGEIVPASALDHYASQAKEDHVLPIIRLIGLIVATGDRRLLQMIAEHIGCAVIEESELHWVDMGRLTAQRDKINSAIEYSKRRARQRGRRK